MNISTLAKRIERFALTKDTWVFSGALFLYGLTFPQLDHSTTHGFTDYVSLWEAYLKIVGALHILFMPTLLFSWHKSRLSASMRKIKYVSLWVGIFILYPILVASLYSLYFDSVSEINILMGVIGIMLTGIEIALIVNTFARSQLKGLTFEKEPILNAFIAALVFILAMILSLMAASNLDSFYTSVLIEQTIDFRLVARNFGAFLSILGIFVLVFGGGFFFYYLNQKWLIPVLLKKRGFLVYAFGSITCIILLYPLMGQFIIIYEALTGNPLFLPSDNALPFDLLNGLGPLVIIIVSLPVIFTLQWFKMRSDIQTLEKHHAETELSLLKQQINPHFFFNTLNNLYALSLQKSQQTPEVIMQLSELMRYVIYEGEKKEVALSNEIAYIRDYIKLQNIRLHQPPDIQIHQEIEDESVQIPPLLLIILVENAFKHGLEKATSPSFMHINIHSTATSLEFTCTNSFENRASDGTGIGLTNLKRRLELAFPNRHHLAVNEQDQIYTAALTLMLNND